MHVHARAQSLSVISILFLVVVLLYMPGSALQAQQAMDADADTAGALGIVTGYVTAWNVHDMNALAGLFAENGEFVNPFGTLFQGHDQIEAEHTERHKTIFPTSKMTADTSGIRFISPDIAVVHFQWTVTGHQAPVVAAGKPLHGITTFVERRDNGKWVIESGQVTLIGTMPGAGQGQVNSK